MKFSDQEAELARQRKEHRIQEATRNREAAAKRMLKKQRNNSRSSEK
jgi:hypothetical protein